VSILSHLLAADVRRHRLLLGAWLLVVAATAAVDGALPFVSARGLGRTADVLAGLLSMTRLLLNLVLIPAVVQTHPLVGSDAFWMTRPIPPGTLLASKLVLLGLATVVAPTLAEVVVMGVYAVPAAQIARVAAQSALYHALWTALLMTAAAVTSSLARFALLCGGTIAGFAALLAVLFAITLARVDDSPPMTGGTGIDDPTTGVVLTALVILAAVATLVVQYVTRSRVRSVAAAAAGLFAAVATAWAWSWPILAPRIDLPAWTAAEGSLRLSASTDTVQVHEEMSPFSQRTPWRLARARVFVAGIEPGWSADAGVRHATLHVDGGSRLESAFSGHAVAVPIEGSEERPTRRVLRELLEVDRLVDSDPPRGESPVVFFLRDAEFRRVAPAVGTYRGQFQITLTSRAVAATLPLRPGASYQNGAYRLVIQGVERGSSSVSILARHSDATSALDRRLVPGISFYLRNGQRREAVGGLANHFDRGSFWPGFLPFVAYGASTSGFIARALVIRFPPAYGEQKESLTIDDEWFNGAELVLVRAARGGSAERTLDIAGFQLRAASQPASATGR
jgi:hypothetical protein